ncbi:hypothetical protein, partial [Adhaeribacter aerolatus]|uniref:hypothetical protein n=1 Tax=Adhaeribacter aerolatus TaxID=670289 RepID=UPI0014797665
PADFDIILLGSSNNILLKGNKLYNRSFYDVIYPRRGMFAYLLKISSIPKIFDNIYPIRICAGGIDTLIGWLVLNKKIKVYHIKDKIIDVDRNLPSNIINPSKQNKLIHIKEFL